MRAFPAQLGRMFPREPIAGYGTLLRTSQGTSGIQPLNLGTNPDTLENGPILQVSDFNAFKPWTQVVFCLTVYNATVTVPNQNFPTWISRVRLKPWWGRQGDEFRMPGGPVSTAGNAPTWTPNDQAQFGGGTVDNNRAVWMPTPKMIDISEFQTVNPPPPAPPRHSDSLIVDDLWTMDLQNPNNAAYQGILLPGQTLLGRSTMFMYVAHGYALGLTHQFTVSGAGPAPRLRIDLTWQTGTL